jgi:hypothetical protein
MNFTGTRTHPGFGKRINWHLVTLASGIALAASLVVAGGAFERSAGSNTVAEPLGPRISIDSPAVADGTTRAVLYIVGSEVEGVALQRQASEAGHEAPGVDRRVLVAASPEDEAAVLTAIGESMQLANFEVVDLR